MATTSMAEIPTASYSRSRMDQLKQMHQLAAMMSKDGIQPPAPSMPPPPAPVAGVADPAEAAAAVLAGVGTRTPGSAGLALMDPTMAQFAEIFMVFLKEREQQMEMSIQSGMRAAAESLETQAQEFQEELRKKNEQQEALKAFQSSQELNSAMLEVSAALDSTKVSMHAQVRDEIEKWRAEAAQDIGNLCDDLNEAREDVAQLMQEVRNTGKKLEQAEQRFDQQTQELRTERFAWLSAREASDANRATVTRQLQDLASELTSKPSTSQGGRFAVIATSMVNMCSEISDQLNELEGRVTAGVASTEARVDSIEGVIAKQVKQDEATPPAHEAEVKGKEAAELGPRVLNLERMVSQIRLDPRVAHLQSAIARMTAAVDIALKEKASVVDETASEMSTGVTVSEKSHKTMGSERNTDATSRTMDPDVAEKLAWVGLDTAGIAAESLSGYSQLQPSRQRPYSAVSGGAASPLPRKPVLPWASKANSDGQFPLAGVASQEGDILLRTFNTRATSPINSSAAVRAVSPVVKGSSMRAPPGSSFAPRASSPKGSIRAPPGSSSPGPPKGSSTWAAPALGGSIRAGLSGSYQAPSQGSSLTVAPGAASGSSLVVPAGGGSFVTAVFGDHDRRTAVRNVDRRISKEPEAGGKMQDRVMAQPLLEAAAASSTPTNVRYSLAVTPVRQASRLLSQPVAFK